MKNLPVTLREFRELVKEHPLILITLGIWLINSPFLWFSGIYVGRGEVGVGGLFFLCYILIGLIDAGIYWLLIFRSK